METRKVRVHRVELLVIDFDDLGEDEVVAVLERTRYPNHCIHPSVKQIDSREVDWSDDHPLNRRDTCDKAYEDLFSEVDLDCPRSSGG